MLPPPIKAIFMMFREGWIELVKPRVRPLMQR
jgi:hypothetical protein